MKAVHMIGVPLDLGGNRRGVDMGPSALRIAGLAERLARLGYSVVDRGDLPSPIPETREWRDERQRYIHDIAKVCQQLYDTASRCLDDGAIPLVLGGDHSLGAGSVAAVVDLRLKHGSGRDVVVSVPADVPVIIFSGVPSESAELERLRPRTRLIEKPYSLVLLVETLEEMLAERTSQNLHS